MKSGRACSTIRPEHRLGERMEKDMKKRSVRINAGGGGSPEQAAERHPYLVYCDNTPLDMSSARRAVPEAHPQYVGTLACDVIRPAMPARFWPQARALSFNAKCRKSTGFTMAEILLSLTIIGVVAAITLPSLTGNINERTWNTQRKALYARFSQAMALMPNLNGYGTLRENTNSAGSTSIEDTAAETFVASGLSKVLKINNVCDSEHLADCGIPTKITTIKGDMINPFPARMSSLNDDMVNISWNDYSGGGHAYSQLDTKAAAFETANGESIAVFYNPNCATDFESRTTMQVQPYICANFVYDLNGTKGPNTVGKDIGFMTAYNSVDSVIVAPMPLMSDAGSYTGYEAAKICKSQDNESRLPNLYELMSMFVNRDLIGNLLTTGVYWTSTLSVNGGSATASYGSMYSGHISGTYRDQGHNVRCIKR